MARLLVLGCSGLKHSTPFPVPAWYRYDGVLFRVCKALEAQHAFPSDVSVRILSAAYGVITRDTPLPLYDREMDAARARELHESVTSALRAAVERSQASEVFVAAGRTYREAIGPLQPGLPLRFPCGGIGMIQAQLRQWLVGELRTPAQLAIPLHNPAAPI